MKEYTPKVWKNEPSTDTPITDVALNRIETGIADNNAAITASEGEISRVEGALSLNKIETSNNKIDIAAHRVLINANTTGVAANKTAIATNVIGIAANKATGIANAQGVAGAVGKISTLETSAAALELRATEEFKKRAILFDTLQEMISSLTLGEGSGCLVIGDE